MTVHFLAWSALLLLGILSVRLIRVALKRDAENMVEEFQRSFPGQCMICSYHRYGLREGHVSGKVKDHDCIENRKENA